MNQQSRLWLYIIGIVIIVFLVGGIVYTVDETEQVIITQFGEPIGGPITKAGLNFKLPFIQKVNTFEKRIMQWDGDANQIPTSDKKYILVDTFSRWKITDPLKFYQSVHNERNAQSRLDDIIDGITRDFITENPLIEIVRNSNRELTVANEEMSDVLLLEADSLKIEKGRHEITRMILERVRELTPQYGIEVLDIRIKQVNYIQEVQEKVFDRMISERTRIAELYRSEGQGSKAEIEGQRDRELQRIRSEAYKRAQQIQGEADAEATNIYANAYSRDPEFYSFLQTMESYKNTIDSTSTLILGTESEYLKFLKNIR
ncbi:protease modulator HflC [candidate division KSB1 bacterium]|nr:protease modulator HflC [candidate division KSB1 bacterium]